MSRLKAMRLGRRGQAPWKRQLPCLVGSDRQAASRSDLDHKGLEHFGQMEFGRLVDAQTHMDQHVAPARPGEAFQTELAVLPTIAEVEQAFRGTEAHKSSNLDDRTHGEALQCSCGCSAAAAFPLMMKAAVRRAYTGPQNPEAESYAGGRGSL